MGEAADENGSLQNEEGNVSAQNADVTSAVQNVNESSSLQNADGRKHPICDWRFHLDRIRLYRRGGHWKICVP